MVVSTKGSPRPSPRPPFGSLAETFSGSTARPLAGAFAGLLAGLLLAGCSGGESEAGDRSGPPPERPGPLADPTLIPEPLLVVQGDPARISAVPDVVAVEILSDSGLQIAYTREAQRETVDPRYVGLQWQHMQRCVGIVAPAPLVIIVAGTIEPLILTDDVLRDIEGRITASAGTGATGIATMQVHEADFDGSIGNPGFALRSIMGRHLWLSAMLAERDYPFRCARASGEAKDARDEQAPVGGIGTVRGAAVRPASLPDEAPASPPFSLVERVPVAR